MFSTQVKNIKKKNDDKKINKKAGKAVLFLGTLEHFERETAKTDGIEEY